MAENIVFADYFLKIEGLQGTTDDAAMKGAFEIKDWSFGVENPTTIGSATGGAGAGKVKFNEFTIKKTSDQASPLFFESSAAGTHYKKATLFCRKAGGDPKNAGSIFLKIQMSDVLVSSYENDLAPNPFTPPPGDIVPVVTTSDLLVIAPSAPVAGDPQDALSLSYRNVAMTSNPTTIAVTPATGGVLLFDAKTNTFTVNDSSDTLTVGTQGGVVSTGVQEFDVTSLLPVLNAGDGTLTLTVNEIRELTEGGSAPPVPDLNFDVFFYAPADLQLTPEDLSRPGKRIGSIHIEPRKDPASLEFNFTNEVREAAIGTFGIRLQLRGGPASDWSGPGDEGPEESPRDPGSVGDEGPEERNASAMFSLDVRFDSN